MSARRKRTPRCPKCKCRHLTLTEITPHTGTIEQDGNGALWGFNGRRCRDLVFEPGLVSGVMATCGSCDHYWRTSLSQITDHPDYEVPDE